VDLAGRDEPTTDLELKAHWLKRLRRASVDQLIAAVDPEKLRAGEIVNPTLARGIAAAGNSGGLPVFVDWFEDESAPVAGCLERLVAYVERWDTLRRLRLAAADMQLVAKTARALAAEDDCARVHERALETALVVIYARTFLPSSTAGVGERWRPKDPTDLELHKASCARSGTHFMRTHNRERAARS
jgi:hypothetical protein